MCLSNLDIDYRTIKLTLFTQSCRVFEHRVVMYLNKAGMYLNEAPRPLAFLCPAMWRSAPPRVALEAAPPPLHFLCSGGATEEPFYSGVRCSSGNKGGDTTIAQYVVVEGERGRGVMAPRHQVR